MSTDERAEQGGTEVFVVMERSGYERSDIAGIFLARDEAEAFATERRQPYVLGEVVIPHGDDFEVVVEAWVTGRVVE